jgi:hypothetical protein
VLIQKDSENKINKQLLSKLYYQKKCRKTSEVVEIGVGSAVAAIAVAEAVTGVGSEGAETEAGSHAVHPQDQETISNWEISCMSAKKESCYSEPLQKMSQNLIEKFSTEGIQINNYSELSKRSWDLSIIT